jgi:thymidylate synthase (FAD)
MKPWQKLHPLTDQNAFICLVDSMGNDSSIVQAARVSYGKDQANNAVPCKCGGTAYAKTRNEHNDGDLFECNTCQLKIEVLHETMNQKDRNLIRYLLRHSHTTPFEMVEFKFMVQVPMDCWRQWVRHRTASINEYSTRYTEALDFFQVTSPQEWRLQATDNKQGSSGFLEDWPEEFRVEDDYISDSEGLPTACQVVTMPDKMFLIIEPKQKPNSYLSGKEQEFHTQARILYEERLALGIAKEQARKDLPLSTYTRAYWKCDLHNIFNFLRLRMDSHAQLEIRQFANCMFEIVKSVCPVACEAFEDYVLHSKKFSRMEMEELKQMLQPQIQAPKYMSKLKPDSMSDREWKEFLEKLQ